MNEIKSRQSLHSMLPSERSFGILFVVVFAMAGAYTLYIGSRTALTVALLSVSVLLATVSLFRPRLLAPLNKVWSALGLLLNKIVSPIVLGAMFFLVITPVALVTRIAGRDPLRLRIKKVNTHWVERSPVGPDPDSFKNQF